MWDSTFFITLQHKRVLKIFIKLFLFKIQRLSVINPIFFSDLHKYEQVIRFLQTNHERNDKRAKAIFARGIEEGVFRSDFDYDLMIRFHNAAMSYLMEKQLYKEYGMASIFRNIVLLFLRGYCTLKGLEILDQLEN